MKKRQYSRRIIAMMLMLLGLTVGRDYSCASADNTSSFVAKPKLTEKNKERTFNITLDPQTLITSDDYSYYGVLLNNITPEILVDDLNDAGTKGKYSVNNNSVTNALKCDGTAVTYGSDIFVRWYSLDANDNGDNTDFHGWYDTNDGNWGKKRQTYWSLNFSNAYNHSGTNYGSPWGYTQACDENDKTYQGCGQYVYRSYNVSANAFRVRFQPYLFYSILGNAKYLEEMTQRQVVCEIAEKAPSSTDCEENEAGFFCVRYIFKFDSTNGFFSSFKQGFEEKSITADVGWTKENDKTYFTGTETDNIVINLTKYEELGLDQKPKYVRWAYVDENGYYKDKSAIWELPDGFTQVANDSKFGYYATSSEGNNELIDNIKINTSDLYALKHGSLVCWISYDEMTDGKEPEADVKVSIKINADFSVTDAEEGDKQSLTATVGDKDTWYEYSSDDSVIKINLNSKLSDVSLDASADIWKRWFIRDGEGNQSTYADGLQLTSLEDYSSSIGSYMKSNDSDFTGYVKVTDTQYVTSDVLVFQLLDMNTRTVVKEITIDFKMFVPLQKLKNDREDKEFDVTLNPETLITSSGHSYYGMILDDIMPKELVNDLNAAGSNGTYSLNNNYLMRDGKAVDYTKNIFVRWYSLDENGDYDNTDFHGWYDGSDSGAASGQTYWSLNFYNAYSNGKNQGSPWGYVQAYDNYDNTYKSCGQYVYRSTKTNSTTANGFAYRFQPYLFYSFKGNAKCLEDMVNRRVVCEIAEKIPSATDNEENTKGFFSVRYIFKFKAANDFVTPSKADLQIKETTATVKEGKSRTKWCTVDEGANQIVVNLSKNKELTELIKDAKYVRWAFQNKNGHYIDASTFVTMPDGFVQATDEAKYGWYNTSDQLTSLLDGIRVSSTELETLRTGMLVCILSNDEKTNDKEPSADVRVFVNIDMIIDAKPNATHVHKYRFIKNDTGNVTLYVWNNHQYLIRQDIDMANITTLKYMKAYLYSNAENKIIPTSEYTFSTSKTSRKTDPLTKITDTDYYEVSYAQDSISGENFTFSLPTGYEWKQVQAVMMFYKDESGTDPAHIAFIYDIVEQPQWYFQHYKGYAYEGSEYSSMAETWDESTKNVDGTMKYQDAHEWEYNVYVKKDETCTLELPVIEGNGAEPSAYFRWYDYNTDLKSERVSNSNYAAYDEGLFMFSNNRYVTTTFTPPSDYEAWQGDDIACDVSRYKDFGDESVITNICHEPTLSVRYIYHVHKAEELADAIKEKLDSDGSFYEDYGYFTIGLDETNAGQGNLRVNLQNATDYWFYPCTFSNGKCSSFSTNMVKATKVVWRAYDTDWKKNSVDLSSTIDKGKMVTLGLSNVSGDKKLGIETGDRFNVVAFASDGINECPVARYIVRFMKKMAPHLFTDLDTYDYNRSLTHLNDSTSGYRLVGHIAFDEDSKGLTLAKPTNVIDNLASLPSKWTHRHYGFVYPGLYEYMDTKTLYAKHGEYVVMKSMGMPGVSDSYNGTGYNKSINGFATYWYLKEISTGTQLYDRTHKLNSSQYGSFIYYEASEEARPVCSTTFKASLCVGSTIVLSAAVADATDATTQPQVVFKLYGCRTDEKTKELVKDKLIHSFSSGDFAAADAKVNGKWYQVFARVTLQAGTGVEDYEYFMIEVDNACANTSGADYCVDDIRLYIQPAKVTITQNQPLCDRSGGESIYDENMTVKLRMLHQSILAMMGESTDWTSRYLRWRVCRSDGTPLDKNFYSIEKGEIETDNESHACVKILVKKDFDAGNKDDSVSYYVDGGGDQWFMIQNQLKGLKEGQSYYISVQVQDNKDNDHPTYTKWGDPNDYCSIYSTYFWLKKQKLRMTTTGNADVNNGIALSCDANASVTIPLKASLIVPNPRDGGEMVLTDVKFDWFVGSSEEYENADYTVGNVTTELSEALKHFRALYPEAKELNTTKTPPASHTEGNVTTTFSQYDYDALNKYVTEKNLYLMIDSIDRTFTKDDNAVKQGKFTLYLIPRSESVVMKSTVNGKSVNDTIYLCMDGREVEMELSRGPKLQLGFQDVTYPSNEVTLRLGKAQLAGMRGDKGKPLQIPISSYTQVWSSENFNLVVNQNYNGVFISKKNGVNYNGSGANNIGKVTKLSQDSIEIKFNDNFIFEEGDRYLLNFEIYDKNQNGKDKPALTDDSEDICYGSVNFNIKIVPEQEYWTGTATTDGSTNWHNDGNWEKFVPMKFTRVIIPTKSNYRYPYLKEEEKKSNGLLAETSLTNDDSYSATEYIQYDLLVKELATEEPKYYTCEKYYGNTCDQIFFKPQAELRNQTQLTYNKAWVEQAFTPNKWYMITTPLSNIWAGDMYLPCETGREDAELFKDITFDTSKNSRSKYPVYQRSWDKANSMEVRPDGDDYLNDFSSDYDAFMEYNNWGNDVNAQMILNNWSHAYNDVTESYDGVNGISIKVGNQDRDTKAIIRLPKADTEYQYYDGNDATVGNIVTLDGKIANAANSYKFRQSTETVTQKLENKSSDNKLYIVGNPYMVSIDMKKFFEDNPKLEKKYWTVIADTVYGEIVNGSTTTYPSINPMQSFLVMKKDGKSVDEVTFNSYMTTGSPVAFTSDAQTRAAQTPTRTETATQHDTILFLEATNVHGGSRAIVEELPTASNDYVSSEDLETIYDSNLADKPTVYTVSGNEALSINALNSLATVPMGVASSSDGDVQLRVSGVGSFVSPLYLLDLKDATATSLADNMELTIAPNAFGRYYLSTDPTIIKKEKIVETAITAHSPTMHTLVVSSLGSPLSSIMVYTLDGKVLISADAHEQQSITINTISGVVVVKATTSNGTTETLKVNVR